MKNKHLILVKHSIPEMLENVPAREWHLSAAGQIKAERLAERLIPFHPDLLISSTEPKAIETAQILGKRLQLPVRIVENLHEHDRSKTGFLSRDKFEQAVLDFFEQPDQLVFGSETAEQTYKRFSTVVFSLLEECRENIVIVSHGTVMSLFISHLLGTSGMEIWRELGLPSFVVLDMNSKTLVAKENISEGESK